MTTESSNPLRRALIVGAIGLIGELVAVSPVWSAQRPSRCPAGRYLVVGDALIAGDTAVPQEPVVIDGPRISIGNVCPRTRGNLAATAKGTTIKANWATCGAQKKVRLRARIDASCHSLRGTLKAKGQPPRPVNAVLSVCGDFIVDPPNAEACEPPGTTTCDAQCRALSPQTTTTITAGSSTSMTVTSSSTSSTSTTLMSCFTDLGLTVVDGCIGLEWEKKTLQNVANQYSIAGATTWLTQLNADNFAGHDDWRLPRMASVGPIATDDPAELETILAAGGPPPRINPLFGPTAADSYWSGSRATPPPEYAPPGVKYPAGIHFGTGFPFFADPSFAAHVRAVRYASGVSLTTTSSVTLVSTTTLLATTSTMTVSTTTTSSTTTLPAVCGDGTLNQASEECDGADAYTCPGACRTDCNCPDQAARVLLRVNLAQVGGRPGHEGFVPTASQPVTG